MKNCNATMCPSGTACMLEENGRANCKPIPRLEDINARKLPICLVDGYQAKNVDDMLQYSLMKGYMVREAYIGRCKGKPMTHDMMLHNCVKNTSQLWTVGKIVRYLLLEFVRE